MDVQHLVHMANQIGRYFDSYPDRAEARAEIAGHIKRFWEPRMRAAILAHADGAEGLDPLVKEALGLLQETV
jgi:formate dehydrogenase subunit delta